MMEAGFTPEKYDTFSKTQWRKIPQGCRRFVSRYQSSPCGKQHSDVMYL
jgi:hypothetical protein